MSLYTSYLRPMGCLLTPIITIYFEVYQYSYEPGYRYRLESESMNECNDEKVDRQLFPADVLLLVHSRSEAPVLLLHCTQ